MKNILVILFITLFVPTKAQTISITNNSGTNSITCQTQSINMIVMCIGFSTISTFTWISPFSVSTGSNVNINTPATYTVATMNGNAMVTQTFIVYQNTVPPVSSISSTFLTISGTVAPTVTLVAVSPTTTIQHEIYSPTGGTLTANTTTMSYTPSAAGTYTHCLFWQTNGCKTCKTFTVSRQPTSVMNYSEADPLNVYQISSYEICVKAAKASVLNLYDLSGRCLKKFNLEVGTNFYAVSDIKPGLYILVSEFDGRKLKITLGN